MDLVKPKGKIIFSSSRNEDLESLLVLSGFINVKFDNTSNCKLTRAFRNCAPINLIVTVSDIICEKPSYEVGSSKKLSFGKKPEPAVSKVWKLDVDEDDEIIDPDELLDEEDKIKPSSESLRVCSTTGKRKACKDCSCGLADELDAEAKGKAIDSNPTQKSSCGSVSSYLEIRIKYVTTDNFLMSDQISF